MNRNPDPPPPNNQWLVMQNGERFGPYDDGILQQYAKDGLIARDSLLWTEGMAEWVPAEAVVGLFPGVPPTPPPPVKPVHAPAARNHWQEQMRKAQLIEEAGKLHRASYGTIFVVAALNLVLGIAAAMTGFKPIRMFGDPSFAIGAGVTYLVLGILVACKSRVALAIALTIFTLDTFVIFYGYAMAGHLPFLTILCRIAFVAFMAQGFAGITQLRKLQVS